MDKPHAPIPPLMQSFKDRKLIINSQSKIIIILIIAIVTLISSATPAQQLERIWYRLFPQNAFSQFYDVAIDKGGFIYATGIVFCLAGQNSYEDYFTVKLHPLTGDTIWTDIYSRTIDNGTGGKAIAKKIAIDSSGNVYVSGGVVINYPICDIVTIKYSPSGDVIWIAESGNNFTIPLGLLDNQNSIFDMQLSTSGNIYIAGGGVILKYNLSGQLLWGVNNIQDVFIKALAIDSDENIIVTGGGIPGATPGSTKKYSSNGTFLWSVPSIGACSPTPFMRDVAIDNDDNVYVGGYTCASGNNKTIRKYSRDGDVLWTKNINTGASRDWVTNLVVDSLNNLYVGGEPPYEQIGGDHTRKYNSNGDLIWIADEPGTIADWYGTSSVMTYMRSDFGKDGTRLAEYSCFEGALIDITAPFYAYLPNWKGSFNSALVMDIGQTKQIVAAGYAGKFNFSNLNRMLAVAYRPEVLPMPPDSLIASFVYPDSIRLNFVDNSIIETGFRVQRRIDNENWQDAVLLPPENPVHPFEIIYTADTASYGGAGYNFRVCAFNNNGQSDWIANNGMKYPSAPTQLSANYGPGNKVTLNWKDNSRIETGNKIERKTTSDTSFHEIGITGENVSSYIDDQLPSPSSGEQYQYRVRAFSNSINSEYSNTASVVFQAPLAPDSLRVNVPEIGTAVLSWIPGSGSNAEGYIMERSVGSSSNFILLDSIPAGDTAYTDSGLTAGTIYWYRMYAHNPFGNSPYSDTVFVLITGLFTGNEIPMSYALYQNYPNPFNPVTNIKFDLPHSSHVRLVIYDILGREVATLINDIKPAGRYNIAWNAGSFSSGVYFYKLDAGEFVDIKRLVLLK